MKKLIIVLVTFMFLLINCDVYAEAQGFSVSISDNVEGYVDEDIQESTITLEIDGEDCVFNDNAISIGDDISTWFTNIPLGLKATVNKLASGNTKLKVDITGKTSSKVNKNIEVTVPANMIIDETGLYYEFAVAVEPNDYAKYIIEERVVNVVYKQDYTVSGKVNEAIDSQDVVVVISGDLLVDDIVGTVLTNDFGLVATITAYDQENNEATITYTGTPTRTSQDEIVTTFLASYFKNYKDNAHVPNRIDVKFDIIDETPLPKPKHIHIIKPIFIPIIIPKIIHVKDDPIIEKEEIQEEEQETPEEEQETPEQEQAVPEKKKDKIKYTQPITGVN